MRKLTRRQTLAAGASLATARLAPAHAAEPTIAEVEAAARREGRLIIYTSSVDADMRALSAAFQLPLSQYFSAPCQLLHAVPLMEPGP